MPNIKKMTEPRKNCLSLAFRFRPTAVQAGYAGPAVANHILNSWCKAIKNAERADNLARHNDPKGHNGKGRAARRVGIKRKGA